MRKNRLSVTILYIALMFGMGLMLFTTAVMGTMHYEGRSLVEAAGIEAMTVLYFWSTVFYPYLPVIKLLITFLIMVAVLYVVISIMHRLFIRREDS